MVKGAASPDDPALTDYWADRRQRMKSPLDEYTLRLLTRQDARCPLCREHLLTVEQPPQSPREWERWWQQVTRADYAALRRSIDAALANLHAACRNRGGRVACASLPGGRRVRLGVAPEGRCKPASRRPLLDLGLQLPAGEE